MIKTLIILTLLSLSGCIFAGEPRPLDILVTENATLSWEYPAELLDNIDHFNVFYSPLADQEIAVEINAGKLLSWKILSMNCVDCRFWVSAVNLAGIESERALGHDLQGNDTFTLTTQSRPLAPVLEVN